MKNIIDAIAYALMVAFGLLLVVAYFTWPLWVSVAAIIIIF